tara:strand:+ start:6807 stop:7511 length:705 start_codon:yes stop_codon:yes gene_type:complete
MAWGDAGNIDTTNLDAGTDSPASARSDLKTALDELAAVINGRGTASGVASLDTNARVPMAQLQQSVAGSFPSSSGLVAGFRVFRSDLGEWFTLMDATTWGGSGLAWVGDRAVPFVGGADVSTTTDPATLSGPGGAGPMDADVGLYLEHDFLLTSLSFSVDASSTGDYNLRVKRDATTVATLSITAGSHAELGAAASNWERVNSGEVLWADVEIPSADTLIDPMFFGTLQKVFDA